MGRTPCSAACSAVGHGQASATDFWERLLAQQFLPASKRRWRSPHGFHPVSRSTRRRRLGYDLFHSVSSTPSEALGRRGRDTQGPARTAPIAGRGGSVEEVWPCARPGVGGTHEGLSDIPTPSVGAESPIVRRLEAEAMYSSKLSLSPGGVQATRLGTSPARGRETLVLRDQPASRCVGCLRRR